MTRGEANASCLRRVPLRSEWYGYPEDGIKLPLAPLRQGQINGPCLMPLSLREGAELFPDDDIEEG